MFANSIGFTIFFQINDRAFDIFLFIKRFNIITILFILYLFAKVVQISSIHAIIFFCDIDVVLGYLSPKFYFVETPELLLHVFPCHLTFILFSFKGVDIKTCTNISNLDTNIIMATSIINTIVLAYLDLMVWNIFKRKTKVLFV